MKNICERFCRGNAAPCRPLLTQNGPDVWTFFILFQKLNSHYQKYSSGTQFKVFISVSQHNSVFQSIQLSQLQQYLFALFANEKLSQISYVTYLQFNHSNINVES